MTDIANRVVSWLLFSRESRYSCCQLVDKVRSEEMKECCYLQGVISAQGIEQIARGLINEAFILKCRLI